MKTQSTISPTLIITISLLLSLILSGCGFDNGMPYIDDYVIEHREELLASITEQEIPSIEFLDPEGIKHTEDWSFVRFYYQAYGFPDGVTEYFYYSEADELIGWEDFNAIFPSWSYSDDWEVGEDGRYYKYSVIWQEGKEVKYKYCYYEAYKICDNFWCVMEVT